MYYTKVRFGNIRLVGKPLAQAAYQELVQEVLPKRAKLRAMNLLTKRPYTEKNSGKKLVEGKYPEDIIDIALAYVKSYGYIDDEALCKGLYFYHMASESPLRIRQKLMEKGIDGDTINACLEEQDAEAMQKLQPVRFSNLHKKESWTKSRQISVNRQRSYNICFGRDIPCL